MAEVARTAPTLTLRQNRPMRNDDTYQIGEVSGRTGLSLRTVRYYEAVGLVAPSGRTDGGFRLYMESDVQRLLLVRALKPAEFSLEQLHEILDLNDRLTADVEPADRAGAEGRLREVLELATQRFQLQRERLIAAELAIELLRRPLGSRPVSEGVR
jgi:MerR family transcriptional regulator, copper efflux regulator